MFLWVRVCVCVVLENLAKLFSLMDPNSPERVAFVSRALKWSSGGSGKLGHPRLHQLLALTLWKGRPGAPVQTAALRGGCEPARGQLSLLMPHAACICVSRFNQVSSWATGGKEGRFCSPPAGPFLPVGLDRTPPASFLGHPPQTGPLVAPCSVFSSHLSQLLNKHLWGLFSPRRGDPGSSWVWFPS